MALRLNETIWVSKIAQQISENKGFQIKCVVINGLEPGQVLKVQSTLRRKGGELGSLCSVTRVEVTCFNTLCYGYSFIHSFIHSLSANIYSVSTLLAVASTELWARRPSPSPHGSHIQVRETDNTHVNKNIGYS